MAGPRSDACAEPAPTVPSWLLSIVIHLVLIVLLGWLLKTAPQGAADEPGRDVGIVLKHFTDEGEFYQGEDDQPVDASDAPASDSLANAIASLPADTGQFDPSDVLPDRHPTIGPGALAGDGVGAAGDLARGASQPKSLSGGKARVEVFGLEGEGSKFVYVFDRSVSMAGPPLAAAKQQLLSSLDSLESTHQFQIVFFNHGQSVFDLSGGQKRIPFATERTKQLARNFVGGITADGGTDRFGALIAALGMRPDVIFFLTDADDPMSAGELERIRQRSRGTSINAIEFGFGPSQGQQNFLVRLAAENSGRFTYVDTSKLGR